MKRGLTMLVLASFLVSTLYVPMVLGAGTVVGVVYKDWTEQECRQELGNYPYITIKSTIENLGLKAEYVKFKGPIIHEGQETGCYCGLEMQNGKQVNYVLNTQKNGCALCKLYEKNAVYYLDPDAVNDPKAVVKANGQDIGCQCAKKEGNKDFEKVENNVCIYVDKSKQNAACKGQFGEDGVKVCSNPQLTTEEQLGNAVADAVTITCCCEPGFKKEQVQNDPKYPGGYKCVKGLGTSSEGDKVCSDLGKQRSLGDWVQCAPSVVPKEYGGQFDSATATDAQRQEHTRTYQETIPDLSGKSISCCCPKDQLKDNTGKCIKEVDDCGQVVKGSVRGTRTDADPAVPVRGGYVDPNFKKSWDPEKIKKINEKNLECYCRKDSIPYGNSTYLIECKAGLVEKDVVFLGKTPAQFARMFELDDAGLTEWFKDFDESSDYNRNFALFNYIRGNPSEQKAIVTFKEIQDGPYKGGIVIMDSGTLDFYNVDVARGGKFVAEGALLVADLLLGVGAAKQAAKYAATKAAQRAMAETAETTAEAAARRASGSLGRNMVRRSSIEQLGTSVSLATRRGNVYEKILQETTEATVRTIDNIGAETAEQVGRKFGPRLTATMTDKELEAAGFSDDMLTYIAKEIKPSAPDLLAEGRLIVKNFATSPDQARVAKAMGQATQLSDKTVKEIAEQAAVRAIRRESTEGLTGITLTTGYRAADGFRTLGDIVGAAFSGKVGKFIGYFAAPIGATYADEMLPSSTSSLVKKSITGVSGGISGAMIGATVGAGAGGVGAIPGALIGFLVGATASLIADSADKTEMLIRWNSAQQTETLNVVISNGMDKTCGKLSDGSGLRLKDTTYSGSEINGWAMTSMAYAATECSIFDSVTSGGDFMVADILPIGLRVKCSGCFTISPGDMCGQKSTQWDGNSRMLSRGSSQPICCNECIRLDDDISDYFNMPATAGAGGQMTSSTVSVG